MQAWIVFCKKNLEVDVMYFPYFRGRQYELIALRELASENLLGNRIIPVVEPVKLSSTLVKTIKIYLKENKPIAVIHNPSVGSFRSDMNNTEKDSYKKEFMSLFKEDNIIKSHIINDDSQEQLSELENQGIEKNELLVINNNRDSLKVYEDEFNNVDPRYVLIPDERAFLRKVKNNRVLLVDKFEKQIRNSDYKHITDEFFSEDHLYFKEEGFEGFADYSIIGDFYLESGFAPYAVAFHIVYFASDKSLRVKHFVSDSNEDIKNPAKKFYEAVEKLAHWYQTESIETTLGLDTLLKHYENETYPGLGSVKKLSIMHHLELIGKYLAGEI